LKRRRSYALLALVAFAALLEGGARLAQPWLAARAPAYYYRQYLSALVTKSPVLVWEGKPNASAVIANPLGEKIGYRLNRLGWRDDEFVPFRKVGNALALGDSFTFGIGVAGEKRYTELLERAFLGLDVWNLGVMGYAPDQYLLLAERWLPPVPWRFLLLQLSNNDVADVAQHGWRGLNSATGIPSALEPPFSQSLVSGFSEAWNLVAYFALLRGERLPEARLEDGLRRLLFSLRETAKLARARQVPLLVIQATDWGEPAYGAKIAREYRDGVIALAREQGFGLMEAAPEELLPPPDLHWTAAAHHHVAEKLVPAVREILFPPKKASSRRRGR
jgi:hypothetical protein